jgi:hypothetical protein
MEDRSFQAIVKMNGTTVAPKKATVKIKRSSFLEVLK